MSVFSVFWAPLHPAQTVKRRVRNVCPGRQGRPPGPILVHQVRANGSQLRSLQGAEKHFNRSCPDSPGGALAETWRGC
jgi:hypothetical protein